MPWSLASCTGKTAIFSLQSRTIRYYCCLFVAIAAQSSRRRRSSSSSSSFTSAGQLPTLSPLLWTTAPPVVVQAHSIDYNAWQHIRARYSPHKLQQGACCGDRQRRSAGIEVVPQCPTRRRRRRRLPLYTLEPTSFSELEASDNDQAAADDDDCLERWEALYQQGQSTRLVLCLCVQI
jgi:hypothetical protein